MTARDTLIETFLSSAGWAEAQRGPLAGDASNRRYERLLHPRFGAGVLMDAPPQKGEDTRPFIHIAEHLRSLGFSAPAILARDTEHGFLLLEDLGDDLFARVVANQPALETSLYEAAVDVLAALHLHPAPTGLVSYTPEVMTDLAALPFTWYLPGADQPATAPQEAAFRSAMQDALNTHAACADVLIQRDYHAENLLWLPKRSGLARVGLLDFQDAMAGHRAYDLVSILEDARRDVPHDLQAQMLDRYIAKTGVDAPGFSAAYATLGAQRNLRIIGVFSRLCIRDGKPHYLDFLPRVWAHLQQDLSHPALGELRETLACLPEPSADVIARIADKCAPHR